ncbi:hypothetical protein [Paraflavitalea sp. CAU 1676]|uniref:hypothetical protein n=1 Tax=Paraflavitalea sp. CAU 1676 TaxID=3032598 RepID=UPI0023DC8C16|nr:hypothetical protein [Paraflavitalea sp. CAU 1676]MDF2191709.1 hypothetical protein [Paraflavitalea sp. CAU 1676]
MSRLSVLLAALLLLSQTHFGQRSLSSTLAPSNKSLYKVIYPVVATSTETGVLPFSAIVVRDIRPDTTKLGFYRSTKDRHSYKYRFTNNTSEELTNFLMAHYNGNLQKGSTQQLVVYLRKMWLSEFDSAELSLHNTHPKNAWLYLKAEVYLQSAEALHPVYRIDTVVYARKHNGYTSGGFITNTLLQGLEELGRTDFAQVMRRRKMTQEQVDAFNSRYFLTPDQWKPAKGVYLSFNEFKKGTPSAPDFEVRFESLTDILYVKEQDGKLYPRKNVWGFCDGEITFIRMGSNFFPLYNHQQTWEFYGTASMEFKAPRMPVIAGASWPLLLASAGVSEVTQYEKRLVNLRAFQVDVENGKFY